MNVGNQNGVDGLQEEGFLSMFAVLLVGEFNISVKYIQVMNHMMVKQHLSVLWAVFFLNSFFFDVEPLFPL